jgi:hypothetical protein
VRDADIINVQEEQNADILDSIEEERRRNLHLFQPPRAD